LEVPFLPPANAGNADQSSQSAQFQAIRPIPGNPANSRQSSQFQAIQPMPSNPANAEQSSQSG
jgi:hypothetical protein